jgi:hypothetical protein
MVIFLNLLQETWVTYNIALMEEMLDAGFWMLDS